MLPRDSFGFTTSMIAWSKERVKRQDRAMRYAAQNPGKACLFNDGGRLILAFAEPNGRVFVLAEREVSSSALALKVHNRFAEVLANFGHIGPVEALDAAIEYALAARRFRAHLASRLNRGLS